MREIVDNLGEEGVLNRGSRASGNGVKDVIVLNGDLCENIWIEDFVMCENVLLSKMMMILVYLGGEVERLSVVVDEIIYSMFTIFGERVNDVDVMFDVEL